MLINSEGRIVDLPHPRTKEEARALTPLLSQLREVLVPSKPYPRDTFNIQQRFRLKA